MAGSVGEFETSARGADVPSPFQDAPAVAAGWYSVPGAQRYWDGEVWTDHVAPLPTGAGLGFTNDEQQMAMFAHLGQLLGLLSGIGGFLVPLVILLAKGKEAPFVRRAAIESLNFWLTGLLAMFVAFVSLFVLVGLVLLPLVGLFWLIMPVVAGIRVNDGVDYRYRSASASSANEDHPARGGARDERPR